MKEKTIVAKVFVINSKGLILALRRSKTDTLRPLTWDLPGGSVEYGEDPADAVVREAEEEAGLKLEGVQLFITKTTNEKSYVVRLLYYAHTYVDKITLSFEHDKYRWVTKQEFDQLNTPSRYKDCLKYLPV